ncbi:MAG: hypothetical protein FJ086_16010, partial [Deltaproteobacteria bacterium]|nr:hypothetical protein [Deltaproteobacteria bacterium]
MLTTPEQLAARLARRGEPGGRAFTVGHASGGVAVEVSLDNDDDPTGVTLWADYEAVARRDGKLPAAPRPLGITLGREGMAHREARASGLVHEWQTGDSEFDAFVYVDAPAAPPGLMEAVLNPPVRAACERLLRRGALWVQLDVEGRVAARFATSPGEPVPAWHVAEWADAFALLQSHLPYVPASGAAHAPPPLQRLVSALGWVGKVGWALNVVYVGLLVGGTAHLLGLDVEDPLPALQLLGLVLLSLGLGAGLSHALGEAVARRARGRADALRLRGRARWAGFGGGSVLGLA